MFGLGRKKEYSYNVGDVVEYNGQYKSKYGLYEVKKRMYKDSKPCYDCRSLSTGKVVLFAENAIKKASISKKEKAEKPKEKPKNTIQQIDARAKQIRKSSGIKEVKKVVAYNMSLKEAKKIAFREAAAKK